MLPSDGSVAINQVASLLEKGAISPRTAVTILNARGVIDVDVDEELAAIRAVDTAGAV